MTGKKTKKAVSQKPEESWYKMNFEYDVKGIIMLGAIFFLLIFSVFNFIALMGVQYDIKNDLQTIKQGVTLRESALALVQEDYNQNNSGSISRESFGDNFSSFAYVDQGQTDMSLDQETAAFTFPAKYDFQKIGDCDEDACGLDSPGECGWYGCPQFKDNKISIGSDTVDLPEELAQQPILSFSTYPLSNRWLVGFVVPNGDGEQGYVYYLDNDSHRWEPLITNDTDIKLIPKYKKQGGNIGFGGTDNDFLVVYGGYQILAYQFSNGQISDISRFLGLRVADGGLFPQITYQGNGQNRRWYMCGTSNNKMPKFVKLWTNGSGYIMGARSFGPDIFPNLKDISVLCKSDNYSQRKVEVVTNQEGKWQAWSFDDQGFDNSLPDYHVQSINIFDKHGKVTAAVVNDIGACGSNECGIDGFKQVGKIYLSNNDSDFIEVNPKENLLFESFGPSLKIKAVFRSSQSIDYSPWYDHLNYLSYAWQAGT